mgnify:CR=1 FL=1
MINREKPLKYVQMYHFAMIEANLFLDTHPNNREAMAYFKRAKQMYDKAVEQYEAQFGPLTAAAAANSTDRWDWVKGPWPWEADV